MRDEHRGSDLPAGWEKEEQLVGAGVFGEVWVGRRRDADGMEGRRVFRLLPLDGQARLREQLHLRLAKLSGLSIPYVSLPNDMWQADDGGLIIACPHHAKPVEALLTSDRGLAKDLEPYEPWARWAASHLGYDAGHARTERLLGQLLTGLAGLHDHGISHGDVRPRNVFVDGAESAGETAWLVDASIGPLARWSEGQMRDPDSAHYHPPEWEGTTQDTTCQADLFALGLTFCEIVLGSDANPRRREDNHNFTADDRRNLLAQLAAHGISCRARRVIAGLLEPVPESRLSTARESLELWLRQNSPSPWRLVPWGVAAGLLILLTLAWRGSGVAAQKMGELSARLQQRDSTVMELSAERDDYKSKLNEMTGTREEIKGMRRQVADVGANLKRIESKIDTLLPTNGTGEITPPSRPVDKAKKHWQNSLPNKANLSALKLYEGQIGAIVTLLKQPRSDLSPDEIAHLKNWHSALTSLVDTKGAKIWAGHDKEFQTLLENAVKQPWVDGDGQGNVVLAKTRLKNVKDAYTKWAAWANDPDMSWADLRSEIQAAPAGQRDILAQWRDAFANPPIVTMQFVSAKSDDWGTAQRNVYVYGSSTKETGWHPWTSNTAHTYGDTDEPPDTIAFQWEPGQRLRIVLEAGRSWQRVGTYNPNLIDYEFKGPLALWQANKVGQIQSGQRLLKFTINDCPGPPR